MRFILVLLLNNGQVSKKAAFESEELKRGFRRCLLESRRL